MIAVIGHDLVAEGIKTGGDSVAAKIFRSLQEMDDTNQGRLGKLGIGDAFYILLCLRGNTLSYPEFTGGSGIIEGQPISLCVECLPHRFRNCAVG